MLRQIRSAFNSPRLCYCKYASSGSTISQTVGVGGIKLTSSGTGIGNAVMNRTFGRNAIVVASPSSADIDGGGTVSGTIPSASSFTLTTAAHNGGAADDGTAYAMVLGYDARDATRGTPTNGILTSRIGGTRLEGFVFDGATSTITVGAKNATLTKNGTGDFTLTFRNPFGTGKTVAVASCVAARVAMVESCDAKSVRIKMYVTSSAAASDATAVHVLVAGSDSNNNGEATLSMPVMSSSRKPRIFGYSVTYTTQAPAYTIGTGDATLADTAVGSATFTFTTPFARAPVVVAMPVGPALNTVKFCQINSCTATAVNVKILTAAAGAVDPDDGNGFNLIGLGWDDATEY